MAKSLNCTPEICYWTLVEWKCKWQLFYPWFKWIDFDAINLQLSASKAAFEYQLVGCINLHLEMQETDFNCHGFGDENHD